MSTYYHVDGEVVAREDATISVLDRGFLYGDGAFETLRVYGGTPFAYEAHVDRLRRTLSVLGMEAACPCPGDLRERIDATLDANALSEAYCRVSVTRGVQPGKLTPARAVDPTVVVIVDSLPRGGRDGTPVWADRGPATVRVVDVEAIPQEAIPGGIKTHNYLNGILARLALRQDDGNGIESEHGIEESPADEALRLDREGCLTEGATSNLFFVADGVLRTPSLDGPLLGGITRETVLGLAREADFPTETGRYEPAALAKASEAFLTNSTWELRPIGAVDGRSLPTGPVTTDLADRYRDRIEKHHY